MNETFKLEEDHIKLIKHMFVEWCDDEYGAPAIDPKRPYGNSDVEIDIARILGWKLKEDRDGDTYLDKKLSEKARKLHEETRTGLQIILCTQSFTPGVYELKEKYDNTSWQYLKA